MAIGWVVRDHKSLRAWQEAHAVAVGVVELSRLFWKPFGGAVFGQLQRSSLSVQLNIAEGYTYGDTRSLTRHLGIAYGSIVETRELLELAAETGIVPSEQLSPLLNHARNAQYLLLGMLQKRRGFS